VKVGPCVVAAAQTVPRAGDVEANMGQHLALARAAAGEGVQVLVFPELSLTGYEVAAARDLAFSEDDARLAPLLDAAHEGPLTLVVGAPVRLGPRLHLGALIVSPDGGVEVYTKHRLGAFPPSAGVDGDVPPAEATVFQPGDRSPLLLFAGHTAAPAVCADVGDPSHARRAAERGAGIYLASMFVIPSEYAAEVANLEALAARHAMAVVFSNFGGPSGGLASAGRSAVHDERGDVLARLEARGTGLVVAERGPATWRARALPTRA
jgi:predicted amidohydrolase